MRLATTAELKLQQRGRWITQRAHLVLDDARRVHAPEPERIRKARLKKNGPACALDIADRALSVGVLEQQVGACERLLYALLAAIRRCRAQELGAAIVMELSSRTTQLLVPLQRRGHQCSSLAAQPFDIYMASSARVIYYRIYRTVESWDSEWPTQVSANVVASSAANDLITRTLPVVDTHTTRTFTVWQQRLLGSQLGHSQLLHRPLCRHLRNSLPSRVGDLADGAPMTGRWESNRR